MPKKQEKLLVKSMAEENWKAKIPEKVRCVFHFADKEDEEGKLLAWDSFKASQVCFSAQVGGGLVRIIHSGSSCCPMAMINRRKSSATSIGSSQCTPRASTTKGINSIAI